MDWLQITAFVGKGRKTYKYQLDIFDEPFITEMFHGHALWWKVTSITLRGQLSRSGHGSEVIDHTNDVHREEHDENMKWTEHASQAANIGNWTIWLLVVLTQNCRQLRLQNLISILGSTVGSHYMLKGACTHIEKEAKPGWPILQHSAKAAHILGEFEANCKMGSPRLSSKKHHFLN